MEVAKPPSIRAKGTRCSSRLSWKATRHGSNLIHYFNGDTNSKWMPYLKGNNRIITTYHQPPDYFYQFFKKCDHVDPSFCALVKRGDSSGFGEAVIALLADDKGRKDMSNRARQRALKFSWPAVAERLMANYQDYGATPKTTGQ